MFLNSRVQEILMYDFVWTCFLWIFDNFSWVKQYTAKYWLTVVPGEAEGWVTKTEEADAAVSAEELKEEREVEAKVAKSIRNRYQKPVQQNQE